MTKQFLRNLYKIGIIYNETTKNYEIEILSEDTENTEMGSTYYFDIVIVHDNKVKQKAIGDIKITDRYTLEVV